VNVRVAIIRIHVPRNSKAFVKTFYKKRHVFDDNFSVTDGQKLTSAYNVEIVFSRMILIVACKQKTDKRSAS
jgi:hypothetical protein